MRKLFLIAAVALLPTLGGCAGLQRLETTWSTVAATTVSPKGVIISAKVFDALEATATNYLRLPRCATTSGPICRQPANTPIIATAIHKGRAARNSLIAFYRTHTDANGNPTALGNQGVYDALQESIKTLTDILSTYVGVAQ